MKQLVTLIFLSILIHFNTAYAQKCLYISSYHHGYAWSDGVEKGLRNTLDGKCEVKQFDMDTKRKKTPELIQKATLEAKKIIENWKPDVVIASDDNASKYLIKPFFKNHSLPFVFCGVNWNTDAYGYPYDNVTGMVEVAPIKDLFKRVTLITGKPKNAFYIGADTLSEKKNLFRYQQEAKQTQINLDHGLAKNQQEWIELYKKAQNYDFVIIGSYSGINDWNLTSIQTYLYLNSQKLSITIHEWMMPYTMYGLTKIPEEQGEWAAEAALYILDGVSPKEIPIVSNRKWDVWVNKEIVNQTNIHIPPKLIKKAKTYIH